MDERSLPFEGLHEIRLDRLLQQDGHRSGRAHLFRGDVLAPIGLRHGDCAQPPTQVLEIRRDGHDRHHLRACGDVEATLAHIAVRATAEADHDVA